MVLSEADAEIKLAALRRQREALDREIADLSLYLELGRRLTSSAGTSFETSMPAAAAAASPSKPAAPRPSGLPEERSGDDDGDAVRPRATRAPDTAVQEAPRPAPVPAPPSAGSADVRGMASAGAAQSGPLQGALSEGVLARRYGRALIEAALAALEEAGRPLHAGEILAVLTRRGFSLPGHDPVAALNTRLWKRSGPGGPIRRMGDAVYALVEPEDAAASRGHPPGADEG